jgi:hypothetical protein
VVGWAHLAQRPRDLRPRQPDVEADGGRGQEIRHVVLAEQLRADERGVVALLRACAQAELGAPVDDPHVVGPHVGVGVRERVE